jgi:hypothetical protein
MRTVGAMCLLIRRRGRRRRRRRVDQLARAENQLTRRQARASGFV